ncbi:MAG: 30S ribosomal protein S6 [Rhodospirillales bacterium]|nr:30S ribosomal protein S6 [Alphaproteobacteria bacterium]MBL6947531.1 30S ribosomal protein S6 [Rhodospirillales bacterium]
MSLYENVFIARQDISVAQVDGLVETFEKIVTDMGGSVPKKELWGLRSLAYKIKKNRKGHYVLMNIDAPGEAVQEMERQMHLNEDVLRYLTTRIDALEEGPSAVLRAKERGDDRGRRGRDDESSARPAPTASASPSPDPTVKDETAQEDVTAEDAPAEEVVAEEAAAEDAPAEEAAAEETPGEGDASEESKKDEGDAQ